MEHGTRLLSTGWSPDYCSRIQSELNACPQFILRVMLSAAPVYGYARRKRRRRTCQRVHFSPYYRLKKAAGGGLFLREAAVHLNDSCRLVHNLADWLLVQHPVAQYSNHSGSPESPDVIPHLSNDKSEELSVPAKANAALRRGS